MKKMKKLFAVLLTLAMVLGMSVTAFATEGDEVDAPMGLSEAIIGGVEPEEGVTVEAYQIIKYNSAGYYEEVLEGTIDKVSSTDGSEAQLNPTAKNVQNLYYNKMGELQAIAEKVTFNGPNEDGQYYYQKLGLGSWLVVVKGANDTVYNPAIISVNQTPDGVDYGQLNLNTNTWNNGDTYLKKSTPTITKTAESADGSDSNVVGTQFGDILKFTVAADIPAYTAEKKNIEYKITDTLTGLTLVVDDEHPVSAKLGTETENNETLKALADVAIQNGATGFEITVDNDEFLTKNAGSKITIVYYAKVTSTTLINVDKLNNTAELDYSNNDGTGTSHKETETKHYTFGIDTKVTGWKDSESQNTTGEFVKINDDGDIEYTETPGEVTKTKGETEFLSGAEFQLHIGTADGPLFTDKQNKNTFATDENGRLQIVGLDDGVDYFLVETKAPTGYTLNTTPIKVHITATYKMDEVTGNTDVLTGYNVEIGGSVTHYGYSYEDGETELINTKETASNPFGFRNTKLTNLPSTGGIGTTIFTIVGCLIMIAAAGLFFASRRKSAK